MSKQLSVGILNHIFSVVPSLKMNWIKNKFAKTERNHTWKWIFISTKNGGIGYDLFWQERKINLEKFLNSLNSVIYLLWNDTEEFLLNVLFSVWNSEKVYLLSHFYWRLGKEGKGGGYHIHEVPVSMTPIIWKLRELQKEIHIPKNSL